MALQHSADFKILFQWPGRRETVAGIEYAVYPAVLLVEGVHHGAIGAPAFYPAEVLRASVEHWNNIPVTINHPQNEQGQYVACHDLDVLGDWAIGRLRNAEFKNGKLMAEVWIDVNRANAKMPTLLSDLDRGVQMEISTGLIGEQVEEEGIWNNEQYQVRLTSMIPDHLALLPGGRGACSWDDGCGIRANENLTREKVLKLVNELSLSQRVRQLQRIIDEMDQPRQSENGPHKIHYVEEVFNGYVIYREESNEGMRIWKQSYMVDQNDNIVLADDRTEVKKQVEYVPINNSKEEIDMNKDVKPCCPKRVAALIDNEATPYTEQDREWLESLNEDQLGKIEVLAQAAEPEPAGGDSAGDSVDNATAGTGEGVTPNQDGSVDSGGNSLADYINSAPPEIRAVLNAGLRQLDRWRKEKIQTILGNESNQFTEDELKVMQDEVLEKLAVMAEATKTASTPTVPNYAGQVGGTVQVNTDVQEEAYVPVTINLGADNK